MHHKLGEESMFSPSGPQDHPNLQGTLFIRSCIECPKLRLKVKHRSHAEQALVPCKHQVRVCEHWLYVRCRTP